MTTSQQQIQSVKRVRITAMVLCFAMGAFALLACASSADAYCVKNKTNESVHVKETRWNSVSRFLQPGRTFCNRQRYLYSRMMAFTVKGSKDKPLCENMEIKGDGYLTITGNPPMERCEGKYVPDGRPGIF